MVSGGGAFGRWLGWGWSPRDGISALIRWDIRALPLSLILSLHLTPTTWGYKESLAIYGPGTELSPESDKAGTLISDLQPLESWKTHSVQFSCSLVSDSLLPHESQHARPPCPSPASGVHPNSCASSQWCHPAISSSVIPFSSCPQSLPASGSFPMNQLFTWGSQSIGVSASASVLQWTPKTGLLQDGLVVSPLNPRDSQEFSPAPQFKSINFSVLSFLHSPTLTSIHDCWKNHNLD